MGFALFSLKKKKKKQDLTHWERDLVFRNGIYGKMRVEAIRFGQNLEWNKHSKTYYNFCGLAKFIDCYNWLNVLTRLFMIVTRYVACVADAIKGKEAVTIP